jgi:hypothetical protein
MNPPKPPPLYTAGMRIESNGSSISARSGIGALGCFARHRTTGKPVLLSNSHVLFPGFDAHPSAAVYQPNFSSCCSSGDMIASRVLDRNKAATDHATTGQPADWYGGYKDGKWYGGFDATLGATWMYNVVGGAWMKTPATFTVSRVDCAIAELLPGVRYKNVLTVNTGETITIDGVNEDPVSILGPAAGITPLYREYVRIVSPGAGGTVLWGTVLSRFCPDGIPNSTKRKDRRGVEHTVTPIWDVAFPVVDDVTLYPKPLFDQILILPRPAPPKPDAGQTDDQYRAKYDYTKFYAESKLEQIVPGDSGSVVIDHQGRVVALLNARKPFLPDMALKPDQKLVEFLTPEWLGVATPIKAVTDHLDIDIPAAGYSGTAPSAGKASSVFVSGYVANPVLDAQRETVRVLRAGLRASRRGKLLLGKIGQHREEFQRLLVSVRPIAAAWQQLHGARWYFHCAENARDSGHVIPTSINGVTRRNLVEKLLPIVSRYATPALRRDLTRYAPWAIDALADATSLGDVPAAVARRPPRP